MAESLLKLTVDDKQYNATLKEAKRGMLALEQSLRAANKSFTDVDKSVVQYAANIGKMNSSATTARGKVQEMSQAFVELSVQYKHLSDEAKNSDVGKAMAKSLEELKARTIEAKRELSSFEHELDATSTSGKGFQSVMSTISGQLGLSIPAFNQAGMAIAGIGAAMQLIRGNVQTALGFEESISQLSSLTGKTGKELDELKGYAIELGSTTTLSASEVADAFKMIGSQQPQLLASGDALRDVTKAAITLSEAAGIELATAAQTLSTSVNQFGGESSNATRFVNVLAAASQKGAGDIAFLGEAVSKSGVLANAVGASYEELVANLEMLAKAGIDASTSGTALRSIIANLEKQSNNQFKPSVVGLTQAFKNLGDAQLSITDYVSIAGKQFFSQAMTLANNADEAKRLTEEITGTNTAEEQAKTNTDNLAGSLKSLGSAWEGLNLTINSSNGFLKTSVDFLTTIVQRYTAIINKLGELYDRARDLIGLGSNGIGDNAGAYGNILGDAIGKPTAADTSGDTGGGGGGLGGGKKKTKKSKSTGHKTTPAERAQQMVAAALQSYAETMREADIRMEVGLDDTLAHQKREMQAQQQLMSAYAKASAVYDDPKYRAAYTDAAERFKSLGKTIKETEDEAKKTKEWFKEAERDFKLNTGSESVSLENRLLTSLGYGRMDADNKALSNIMGKALKHGIDTSFIPVRDIQERLAEGMDIPDNTWKEIATTLNAKLKELGIEPVKIDVETGELDKMGKKVKSSWQDAANAIQAAGGALQQIENPVAKVAGLIGEAIANIALGFSQASAKEGGKGIWNWIAATAAGLGTMITTISAIKSATAGSYAEGGIVPGHNYSDGLIANVSSGELILNRAQQGVIANQLQGGLSDLHLETSFSTEKIRISLNNNSRRRGHGEYVTSRG